MRSFVEVLITIALAALTSACEAEVGLNLQKTNQAGTEPCPTQAQPECTTFQEYRNSVGSEEWELTLFAFLDDFQRLQLLPGVGIATQLDSSVGYTRTYTGEGPVQTAHRMQPFIVYSPPFASDSSLTAEWPMMPKRHKLEGLQSWLSASSSIRFEWRVSGRTGKGLASISAKKRPLHWYYQHEYEGRARTCMELRSQPPITAAQVLTLNEHRTAPSELDEDVSLVVRDIIMEAHALRGIEVEEESP